MNIVVKLFQLGSNSNTFKECVEHILCDESLLTINLLQIFYSSFS